MLFATKKVFFAKETVSLNWHGAKEFEKSVIL